MLTPILIQIFFWVGTISCVVTGIGTMAGTGSRAISHGETAITSESQPITTGPIVTRGGPRRPALSPGGVA